MTLRDICPGLETAPLIDQALEVCSRSCGDLRLALTSRHLIRSDRGHLERALRHQELLQKVLIGMKEGTRQQAVPSGGGTIMRAPDGSWYPVPDEPDEESA